MDNRIKIYQHQGFKTEYLFQKGVDFFQYRESQIKGHYKLDLSKANQFLSGYRLIKPGKEFYIIATNKINDYESITISNS